MFIFLNACTWLEPACKLTESDKEWVLSDVDSLLYLKNSSSIVAVEVETTYGQSSYDYEMGIPHGDNNYWALTRVFIDFGELKRSELQYKVEACWSTVDLTQLDYINGEFIKPIHDSFYKDSIHKAAVVSLDIEYQNCVKLTRTQNSLIKEFYFVKNYGIVKLVTTDGDVYELIPN